MSRGYEKLFLVRSSAEIVNGYAVELGKGFVLQQKVPPVYRKDFGSSYWARTSDTLINSQVLCRLS